MASSPISSLSSLGSDDFPEDARQTDHEASDDNDSTAIRPSKRRRVMHRPASPTAYDSPSMAIGVIEATDWTDISSDTSGSVPGSPRTLKELAMPDEELIGTDQVRACSWDGCHVGDLGTVDGLVAHLNDDHVGAAKRTKFTCEWSDCKAKGKTQMSAYALKAHLRSHTKEKPFYCLLPECDRSFTRSDALAKHMRTVHETESLRTIEHYGRYGHPVLPSATADATPRPATPQPPITTPSTAPIKAPARLKLVLSSSKTSAPPNPQLLPNPEPAAPTSPLSPTTRDQVFGALPTDLEFTASETTLPRNELFRLLRRQVHWATQESSRLAKDVAKLEDRRKAEWMGKELVLENALEAQLAVVARRGVLGDLRGHGLDPRMEDNLLHVLEEREDSYMTARMVEGRRVVDGMVEDQGLATRLPLEGRVQPWYRSSMWKKEMDERERAAELGGISSSSEGDGDDGDEEVGDGYGDGGDDTELEDIGEDGI